MRKNSNLEDLELHYMDFDFFLSFKTIVVIENLNEKTCFDLSNLDENHEFFSFEKEKLLGKLILNFLNLFGLNNYVY